MNTLKNRAAAITASVVLGLSFAAGATAATTASAASTDVATVQSVPGAHASRQIRPDQHTKSAAAHRIKQAAKSAEQNPVAALLMAAATALILFVKLFTPAAVYQAMVAAIKKSVEAMQSWINSMPTWLRTFLRGLSLGGLWRALKSLIGLL